MKNLIEFEIFWIVLVLYIGSAILNFENPISDLYSAIQKPKYHQFYQGPNIFDNFRPPY